MPKLADIETTKVAAPVGSYTYVETPELVTNGIAGAFSITSVRWHAVWLGTASQAEEQVSDYRTREQVIWGPTIVDDLTLEAMRAVRNAGYHPLSAQPLPLQDA
jgi:hypothetical protein